MEQILHLKVEVKLLFVLHSFHTVCKLKLFPQTLQLGSRSWRLDLGPPADTSGAVEQSWGQLRGALEYVTCMYVQDFGFLSEFFWVTFCFVFFFPDFFGILCLAQWSSGVCCWGPAVSRAGVCHTGCRLAPPPSTSADFTLKSADPTVLTY